MKKLFLCLALCIAVPLAPVGCSTPQSAQVVEYQTLQGLENTVKAALVLSGHLREGGTITDAQAKQAMDFFDHQWQPAFRLAVSAARTAAKDPAAVAAGPDLINLASQFTILVASFQKHTP